MRSENLKTMAEAADLLNRTMRKLVVSDKGLHAETLIASAARMSGTMLFRSFAAQQFDHLPPGTIALSDESEVHGPLLMEMMFATLKQLGHADIDERDLDGAQHTTALSKLSLPETQEILEPWFRKVQEVCNLSYREIAGSASMATALLIHDCRSVLDIQAGCAIAVYGMIESLKTVPPRVAQAS